jgi:hypothetical protein
VKAAEPALGNATIRPEPATVAAVFVKRDRAARGDSVLGETFVLV